MTASNTITADKVTSLKYSPAAVRAALIALKGAEKGPATFEAVAPAFSALIASGGNVVEFSPTSATAQVFKELHAESLKTPTAKAFKACAVQALADFKANKRAVSQDAHDARLLALSAVWCAFFKDVTAKAKPDGYESPTQKIARLEGELVSVKIERDALATALKAALKAATAHVTA